VKFFLSHQEKLSNPVCQFPCHNKPSLLFRKIEDSEIEDQLQKLIKNREMAEAQNAQLIPQKDETSFDDFSKMDIRVATIKEAEKVPKTKKLMKLTVDTGLDIKIPTTE